MEEIEALLKAPDAITETNILELLGRYIAAGGEPQRAVQFLSEGYRGYAQMTQLVCEWVHLVNSDTDIDSNTGRVDDEIEINRAAAAAQGYLSQLVMENFNPRVADTVFSTAKTSRPPAWLDFLVHDAEGRKLVYALAESTQERHMGTCLLLNFAIQTIWKQGLFQSSSSSTPDDASKLSPPAPAVAAAYFGVYHRVLLDRLDALRGVGGDQYDDDEGSGLTASKQLADVRALACHSQYTYLYAQMLLSELASLPGGRAYRRVAQELEAAAVEDGKAEDNATNNNHHLQKGRGAAARRLTALLLPAGRASPENLEAAQCVADMLQEGATVLGDMRRLHRLYFPPSNPTSSTPSPSPAAPSAELLRHPSFLSLLLGDLFNPRKQGGAGGVGAGGIGGGVNPAYRDEYLHVLAYAACAKDDRERGGGIDTEEVERTVAALSAALRIVELAASGTRPRAGGESVGDPVQALQVPVAAMGVLHWVVVHLKDNNYYKSINQYAATPVYLELIEMIAPLQPRQHSVILDVLLQGLKIAGSELGSTAVAELKKRFIDALVVLVRSGCIDPALMSVKRWVRQSSSGRIYDLARYFVVQLLDSVAPPFSRAFAGHVLDLIVAIRGDAFGNGPGVRNFAMFCKDASFDPPLGDDRTSAVMQLIEGVK